MKQPCDKHEDIDACEQQNAVTTLEWRTVAKKDTPASGGWDFGEPEPESSSLAANRAAIFAHEIANSFTAIGCSLQFVKAELEANRIDDPVLNKVVQGALAEIDGMGTLLHEYCAMVESQPRAWETIDLAALVEDVLALQSIVCRAAGIIVKFEREVAVPWVRLDPLKIKQVISNLCKNAKEAMPRGGRLTLKVYRSGRTVVLEVSDSGIGVPHGVDVFELFKTTKPTGRGLGLPLAREIISAHHGTIGFTNKADCGATFKVSLPLHQ